MRFHAAACSSFHSPRQPGVMRASGETQVISAKTSAGAAERARAEMDEMEIVRHAVRGRIHRHRRHDDAVLQASARARDTA